jgi:hypothetical protein
MVAKKAVWSVTVMAAQWEEESAIWKADMLEKSKAGMMVELLVAAVVAELD